MLMFYISALALKPLIGYGIINSSNALIYVEPHQRQSIMSNFFIRDKLIAILKACITNENLSQSHQTWSPDNIANTIFRYINDSEEAGFHTAYIIEDEQHLPLGMAHFTEKHCGEGKAEFLELALIDYHDIPQVLDLCLKHYQMHQTCFKNKRVAISLHPSLINEYFEQTKWSVVSDMPDFLTQSWIYFKKQTLPHFLKHFIGESLPLCHAFERIQLDHTIE